MGRSTPPLFRSLILGVGLVCLPAQHAADPPAVPVESGSAEPLDLGIEEQVDVRLILVDFLVLDGKGRTVADLTREDFDLVAGFEPTEIATFDVDCPTGETDDPRPGDVPPPRDDRVAAGPRRMVLVFDYFHMVNAPATFEQALASIDEWATGDEEHMVISLGNVLRIEMPFTTDLDDVRWTLQRMHDDPDLYAGNHARLTEFKFFERLQTLFDVLELWPGRKSVVLFSGPFQPDGFYHDPQHREISGLSTEIRTSVYPVDTSGLVAYQSLGGPAELRRLANETGGRMTSDVNDVGVAYAKAHRDLGCTYTLGFYVDNPDPDRERRLTIRVRDRWGLRVVYPEFYVVRSPEEKQQSLFRSAAMAPQVFESEQVDTNLFVIQPVSARRWHAVMAVGVRLGPEVVVPEDQDWTMRGIVRRENGTILHSFKHTVRIPATKPGSPPPAITVFEELRVRPGRYLVSAVLSDPDADAPYAATRPAVVSRIPRGRPFLVGPVLGAPAPEMLFEPRLGSETERGEPLHSLAVVCVVDPDDPVELESLARGVVSSDGREALRYEPVSFRFSGESNVDCRAQIDPVSTAELPPGRYEMTAAAETSELVAGTGSVEFTVRAAGD